MPFLRTAVPVNASLTVMAPISFSMLVGKPPASALPRNHEPSITAVSPSPRRFMEKLPGVRDPILPSGDDNSRAAKVENIPYAEGSTYGADVRALARRAPQHKITAETPSRSLVMGQATFDIGMVGLGVMW